MSEWKINLVSGIIALVFGIALVLFSTTLTIPSLKSTTLNCGLLLIGGGGGSIPSTYTIYKLEKMLASLSSSSP